MDGDKAQEFSSSFTALGINIDLSHFAEGFINFSNTGKRIEELSASMEKLLAKGATGKRHHVGSGIAKAQGKNAICRQSDFW